MAQKIALSHGQRKKINPTLLSGAASKYVDSCSAPGIYLIKKTHTYGLSKVICDIYYNKWATHCRVL